MSFTIPNTPDTAHGDIAEPDAGDFNALGVRSTGVLSGCAVTAQGSPNLSVAVASGVVVVDGVVSSVTAGNVVVQPGDSSPRFDLILAAKTSGALSALRGTASTNPRFPAFDAALYVVLASVYVRASTTSILSTDITDKRIMMEATFQRRYADGTADGTTAAIDLTNTFDGKTFKVISSGEHRWMSNILKRTADSAMEWATSLTIKAADLTLPLVTLRARALDTAAQRMLKFVAADGTTEIAYVNGSGQLYAENFRFGNGTPEGTVTANKGTLYVDRDVPVNAALWLKTTDASNTGWVSFRQFVSNESALPTGTVLPYLGPTAPVGYVLANGNAYATTGGTYDALYNMIGTNYGSPGAGLFNVPDFRGRLLTMVGGTLNLAMYDLSGIADAQVTLSIDNMPSHDHDIADPGHAHPKPGPFWFFKEPSDPTGYHPSTSEPLTTPHMWYVKGFDDSQVTGIDVLARGSGTAFSVLPPVAAVQYIIKL